MGSQVKRTLVFHAALAAVVLSGCASSRPVWFTPNVASRDMLRLFSHEQEWEKARQRVGVFKFYAGQLGPAEACADCGGNDLAHLVDVSAFQQLARWEIAVAVEAPAVKHWGCSADSTLPVMRNALETVGGVGAHVDWVALDEPLIGGEQCGQAVERTAAEVARYAEALSGLAPAIGVGDVEPYPHFDAPSLVAWLDLLLARGYRPAFFHLDVDRARAKLLGKDVAADVVVLRDACRDRGIPFGVIFWGGDRLDEAAYAKDVLDWVTQVRAAIGEPEQIVFQSWSAGADGRREVPINLPEDARDVWTHTRLIRAGLSVLESGPTTHRD